MKLTVRPGDGGYPVRLMDIPGKPKQLYIDGDPSILEGPVIAVVGSRSCSAYGRHVAEMIGRRAAECGVTLVSGLARGIDSAAQQACIDAGGRTASVMAFGLDICYPAENRRLMEKIREKGVLVSEYPEGTEPRPFRFPERNRIISGLSESVVVVEAGFHSGALLTAEQAAEQSRDIWAVPGDITRKGSLGTNKLIQDGAYILTTPGDPFTGLHAVTGNRRKDDSLGEDERIIFDVLSEKGEQTMEELVAGTCMSPAGVGRIVTLMEMKGILTTCMGRVFIDESFFD